MADWYVSSAAYAAITTYTISTAYTVGQIVKPTAPALKAQWAMRCTVAGTSAASEPSWPTTNNGTVVSGGATFANVSGQGAYGWIAAAGDLQTLMGAVGPNRFVAGDRLFVSSDHAETQTATSTYGSGGGGLSFSGGQVLSVNRAGSVPPVAADLTVGASVTVSSGSIIFETAFPVYHYGISFINTSASTTAIMIGNSNAKGHHLEACQLYLNNSSTACRITTANAASLVLNNSTVRFGSTSQLITASASGNLELTWVNTASAIAGAIFPSTLFAATAGGWPVLATLRGVDLSAITGTLVQQANFGVKVLFDSCRIASGVTRYNATSVANIRDEVELVNCYDGTNIISERYVPAGAVTTERTITLAGGATDDAGTFSHKLVSNTNVDKFTNPLGGFWLDVEYQTTGSSKTATVEIISSASLNTDDISLLLEYQATAGSSAASFGTSLPPALTPAAALPASTATWNSSPATPVKQQLSVAFVPLLAGRVRGQVRLGRASTTVYVNPVITIA